MSFNYVYICDCRPWLNCVCDICQDVTGTEKDVPLSEHLEPEANCQNCRDGYCQGHSKQVENPKDIIGSNKIPVNLMSPAGVYMGALGRLDGMLKYGKNNVRAADVKYTIYLDAIKRHCDALLECEDDDPDSGLHHLCHIIASADVLAEGKAHGTLIDDRNYRKRPFWRQFVNEMTTHVARLKEKHKDKHPKHWDARDNE